MTEIGKCLKKKTFEICLNLEIEFTLSILIPLMKALYIDEFTASPRAFSKSHQRIF